VRDRHHRVGENFVVAGRQHLLADAAGDELEPGARGAAHAERIPAALALKGVVAFQKDHEHLIAARRIG
jgi:hypothetical protein